MGAPIAGPNAHAALAAAWIAWCAMHSALIGRRWTIAARRVLGPGFAWYRLGYNAFSILSLAPVIWLQARTRGLLLWAWPDWALPLEGAILLLSCAVLLLGARGYDQAAFFGLRQIRRPERGSDPAAATPTLSRDGIHGRIRHPYYTAGILAVAAWGDVTTATAIAKSVLIAYFVVGAALEERKLVLEFGEAYRSYRRDVPMFFPRVRRRGTRRTSATQEK